MKSTSSALVAKMGEHRDPNSQMELVGHSIVRTLSPLLLSYFIHTHPHKHTQRHDMHGKQAWTYELVVGKCLMFNLWFWILPYLYWVMRRRFTSFYLIMQVLTSYPYSDPQYGGILTHYGPQAMVCKLQ